MWWRYIDHIFLLWQHGEEKLKEFLDILNRYHVSIKFTSKYYRERIDFFDVKKIKEGNQLLTDVFVKSTDIHQYLYATSCHVYHSKKSIPYSQALRFNRICSENQFFDKRCNDLEVWLKSRGCNDKLVRQQFLKARKYRRIELLHSQREEVHKNKLVFNITYYPIFSKLKYILCKIYLLLTPHREHRKVFENVPIIGFKKGKSSKDILVRAKVPPLKTKKAFCGPCNELRCEICKHITKTHLSESSSRSLDRKILIAPLRMQFTFLLVKPAISNRQEALKNFKVHLIIINVRITGADPGGGPKGLLPLKFNF